MAIGSNNLVQGRSMDNMMRFKAQVMPGGTTLNPALSVCAPCPIPPAHTKYGIDDHHAGLSWSELQNPEGPLCPQVHSQPPPLSRVARAGERGEETPERPQENPHGPGYCHLFQKAPQDCLNAPVNYATCIINQS